jgi:hypothetical protein
MASYIERRKFLATLSGAAVAWRWRRAQQQPSMPVQQGPRLTALGRASARLKQDCLRRGPDLLPAHLIRSQAGV